MSGRDDFVLDLIEHVGPAFLKTWMTTLRWRIVHSERAVKARRDFGTVIYAFWHSRIMIAGYVGRNRGIRILISQHRDGEIVARSVKGLGYNPVRGSTTRGGVQALKELVDSSEHVSLAITPDGPRGPREKAHVGAIVLAEFTGCPIVCGGCASRPAIHAPSWDRFEIPAPFARATVVYGDPIIVPRGLDDAGREGYRARLQQVLDDLSREADDVVTRWRGINRGEWI
jgi:hypothetical protein